MQATIAAALQTDPTIDGILTLGPSVAGPALAAIDRLRQAAVHLATFDLSADVLTAIKDGKMDFAIDQQQFLQGYLPIVILTNYARDPQPPDGRRHRSDHDRSGLRHRRTTQPTSSPSRRRACADLSVTASADRRHSERGPGRRPVPLRPDPRRESMTTTRRPNRAGRRVRIDFARSRWPSACSQSRPSGALVIVVFVFIVFAGPVGDRAAARRSCRSRASSTTSGSRPRSGSSRTAVALLMIAGEFDLSVGLAGRLRGHPHRHRRRRSGACRSGCRSCCRWPSRPGSASSTA